MKLKAGVLGAGHLGKIHLKLLQQSEKYELAGFYDPDESNGEKVESEFGYKFFNSIEALIDAVDVVDIVTPTLSHFTCAIKAITKGKHVFIEKPITNTVEEAEQIRLLVSESNLRGQVGHVERFNPAFKAVKEDIQSPMFIETHRLAEFNPRGTDVPVVLDLMIHDIDIILSVVKSPVKNITASDIGNRMTKLLGHIENQRDANLAITISSSVSLVSSVLVPNSLSVVFKPGIVIGSFFSSTFFLRIKFKLERIDEMMRRTRKLEIHHFFIEIFIFLVICNVKFIGIICNPTCSVRYMIIFGIYPGPSQHGAINPDGIVAP